MGSLHSRPSGAGAQTYSDGQVVGSVIGVLGAASGAWTPILEPDGTPSVRKLEGLVIDADGASG